jgi:hypothetical protein
MHVLHQNNELAATDLYLLIDHFAERQKVDPKDIASEIENFIKCVGKFHFHLF